MFCWLSATDGMDAFAELGATVQGAQSNIGTKKTFFFFCFMNNFVKGWNQILSVLINSFALSHR